MHLPLAFSIHHFISSVGADAGFAAIIGLAILVLLYFAQARETTTLRDEAISASQRVEQLERRVAQMGGPPVAPAPDSAASNTQAGTTTPAPGAPPSGVRVAPARAAANPVPSATPGAASPATAAGSSAASAGSERAPLPQPSPAPAPIPAAPPGVGAPALADATRLIPAEAAQPVADAARSVPQAGQPAGQASQPAKQPAQPPTQGAAGATHAGQPPTQATQAGQPASQAAQPPAQGAAGAMAPREDEAAAQESSGGEGESEREPQSPGEGAVPKPAPSALATPPPATAAAGAGQTQSSGESAAPPVAANGGGGPARPRPATAASPRQLPPRLQVRDGPRSPGPLSGGVRTARNRWLPALVGVLLLAGVIAVLLVVTSGGGSSQHSAATRSTNAPAAKSGFNPGSVTVAVLNGTDVSQLAHRVQQKLTRGGYKAGTVATAADQTHKTTVVGFLPGFQGNAAHVASSLGLPSSAVQPVDQSARAIACPPPSACGASVVVIVGSDLASTK